MIGAILYFGVRISTRSQLALALVSIVVVGIFFIYVIIKLGSANSLKPFDPSSAADGWSGIIFGMLYGVLLFVGFETAANLADGDARPAPAAGEFGRLDGLVLNAGVMAPGGVADLSPGDWSAMVSVNLTGAFLVARAALPHLRASRGAVVAVASVAALRAASQMGGYAATKAGLAMLTQSLAVDHAHEGLRANVVCPGWTVTEMADEEMAAFGAERGVGVADAYALVTALVPQRRGPRRRGRGGGGLAAVRRGVLRQRRRDPGGRLRGGRGRRDHGVRPEGQPAAGGRQRALRHRLTRQAGRGITRVVWEPGSAARWRTPG